MELKFKKTHPDAVTPTKAHDTDAGFDLTAVSLEYNNELDIFEYDTGIAVEIPPGYVGFLTCRGSVSKTGFHLCNGVGTVDSPYRGSIRARFYKRMIPGMRSQPYKVGDKIGQLIILELPKFELREVEELSDSSRGEGRFGSTGK